MISLFESKLQTLSADSRAKYLRVLSSFEVFLIGHSLLLKDLSPRIVDDWVYDLIRKDKPKSTIVRSLNILSSLFGREEARSRAVTPEDDSPLRDVAARARELARRFDKSPFTVAPLIPDRNVNACLSSLRASIKGAGEAGVAQDLLTVSLLGGAIPLSDLIRLRKASIPDFSGKGKEILRRNESPTRDYVFDLRQSYRTPRQILQSLADDLAAKFPVIASSLKSSGGSRGSSLDPDQFIRSLWAALAIRCGALASEALGCVGSAGYAQTDFLSAEPQDAEKRERWTKAVATMIARDTSHWYAMHLRRGVTFDELRREIASAIKPVPALFYPCRDISRTLRGRKIIDQQPYITSTVFFRTDPSSVLPMFEKIGDKAWCYRITATPGAPYAIIPTHEMQRFQSAIGQFTPDTELHPLGTLTLKPDDNVILLMADFYNQPARVSRILSTSTGRTIYRVAFTTTTGIEWAVDAAPAQLRAPERRLPQSDKVQKSGIIKNTNGILSGSKII